MGVSAAAKLLLAMMACLLIGFAGSTPEATITDFVRYMNAQSYSKAAALVKGGKPNADYTTIASIMKPMRVSVASMKTEVHGDRATVSLKATLSGGPRGSQTEAEKVNLVKVNGQWLIVPPPDNGVGTGMISSLAGVTTAPGEIFTKAKSAAKKTACLSNLKQIATAAMMLLTDNDDIFTFNVSTAKSSLLPYLKSDRIWFCPEKPDTVAYSFNPKLTGLAYSKVRNPANTVLFYEGSQGKLDFRHNGTAGVAFADGHVKSFKPADAAKLNWKP